MRLFVLTGAGISAESGMGTFRDAGGIWDEFDPMTLATPEAFAADPERVHAFYNLRRKNLVEAEPNAAHAALGRLETELSSASGTVFLCTQNIDDLHERGGSGSVHHMHGELLKALCQRCGARMTWVGDMGVGSECEACGESGGLRPDVVWFGEIPYSLKMLETELAKSDLFVSIGTSGAVYPASGFVAQARAQGVRTCEINLEPSNNAVVFDERRYGPATETVSAWVDEVLDLIRSGWV